MPVPAASPLGPVVSMMTTPAPSAGAPQAVNSWVIGTPLLSHPLTTAGSVT